MSLGGLSLDLRHLRPPVGLVIRLKQYSADYAKSHLVINMTTVTTVHGNV